MPDSLETLRRLREQSLEDALASLARAREAEAQSEASRHAARIDEQRRRAALDEAGRTERRARAEPRSAIEFVTAAAHLDSLRDQLLQAEQELAARQHDLDAKQAETAECTAAVAHARAEIRAVEKTIERRAATAAQQRERRREADLE